MGWLLGPRGTCLTDFGYPAAGKVAPGVGGTNVDAGRAETVVVGVLVHGAITVVGTTGREGGREDRKRLLVPGASPFSVAPAGLPLGPPTPGSVCIQPPWRSRLVSLLSSPTATTTIRTTTKRTTAIYCALNLVPGTALNISHTFSYNPEKCVLLSSSFYRSMSAWELK